MQRLTQLLKLNDTKTKTVFRNVFFSFFIKTINIAVNFLTIPLVLSFLSTTQYGIWLTLTAILSWFSFFDLGLGNGLRNKLTTSIADKNYEDGKIYVSTTYGSLAVIFGVLLIVFLIVNPFVNWTLVFNAPPSAASDLKMAVTYAISLLFVQFVLRLIITVLLALQRSALADLVNVIVQILVFFGLYLLKFYHFSTLAYVALVYSVIPVFVFLIVSLFLFSTTYKHLRPSFSHVRLEHAKGLLNIGLNFFIIQIAALVIYASDNFIISQLFTPSDVTTYNIAFKYFSVGSIFFTIILTPFWSMTTKAFAEKDLDWIKKTMKKLFIFWAFLVCILILQLLISEKLYSIWTNNAIGVPLSLSIIMCLYYIIITWGSIFSNFLNGVGKVKLQLYFATASMILNIPLAITFIKVFKFGIIGIPMATIIVTGIASLISYLQYRKIVNLSATGIWNR
ncbi:oligosaccharide flippase family protein [Pedobacter jejuensis]|uniref:oligosaccharide flippase family protein n=1 Tax=Pedobacter jejuensis TaxID=1268550 RepID=UPI00142E89E8|nr:oligosaccharide flippase family protein [Pedobacter jejuensis]